MVQVRELSEVQMCEPLIGFDSGGAHSYGREAMARIGVDFVHIHCHLPMA